MDEWIATWQEAPEDTPLTSEQENSFLELLADYHTGEAFLATLAEHSPRKARLVLTQLGTRINPGDLPPFERIVTQVEEAKEAAMLECLSDDALEAHLILLALMPTDSPETWRRARPMAVVLARRNPSRLMELSCSGQNDPDELWVRLRREQFFLYNRSNFELAYLLLADVHDGWRWFTSLLEKVQLTMEFRQRVFERVMELTPTLTEMPIQKLFRELIEHIEKSGQETERLTLLTAFVPHVELLPPLSRPDLLKWLLQAGRVLERREQQALVRTLRQELVPQLILRYQSKAKRRLFWAWLGR